MKLVHKSVYIRSDVWRRLRINAELSDCSLRDYLTYLIELSDPIDDADGNALTRIDQVIKANRLPRAKG